MTTKCGPCGKALGSGETIHVACEGPREDAEGAPHTFTFRSMLVPTGHEIEALEITSDARAGYQPMQLAALLLEKMTEELSENEAKNLVSAPRRASR